MELYYAQCTATGEGFNEGWIAGEMDEFAFKYIEDVYRWLEEYGYKGTKRGLKQAYEDGYIYWSEWYDEDPRYQEVDGVLICIEEN